MQKCNSCQGILLPGANFCHKCGANASVKNESTVVSDEEATITTLFSSAPKNIDFEVIEQTENIEKNTVESFLENIKEAKIDLGEPVVEVKKEVPNDLKLIDFVDFKALFFNALHARVQDEHNPKQYSDFVERFYRKNFLNTLTQRYDALIDEFLVVEKKMVSPEKPKERLMDNTIENLVDYFIYSYCHDLSDIYPSQIILRYADAKPTDIKNSAFFYDFLQLKDEKIVVYRDFISMPQEKLKNTFQSYLFTEREEMVYFICDLSITGNGKEGFAISNKRLYWRMSLGKSHSVSFDNINSIKHREEWLEVNGLFFNINKSLNMKVLRMLKKIKMIYEC